MYTGQDLFDAAMDDDLVKLQACLAQHNPKIDPNWNDNPSGWTAMIAACRVGSHRCASALFLHGASVTLHDNNRDKTPLGAACFKGHTDIVRWLMSTPAKAEIDFQFSNQWTALIDAAYVGAADVVKVLLQFNAKTDIVDDNGLTALQEAERALANYAKLLAQGVALGSQQSYRDIIAVLGAKK